MKYLLYIVNENLSYFIDHLDQLIDMLKVNTYRITLATNQPADISCIKIFVLSVL